MLPAALLSGLVLATPRAAAAGEPPPDPSLHALVQAALRHAGLAHLDKLPRRLRASAAAPSLRVGVARGTGVLQSTTELDGTTRLTIGDHDAWQVSVTATWALDRLVFHPEEVRLLRELQRASARRQRLVAEVAALAVERRRIRAQLALSPPATPLEASDALLRLDEVTAVLDELTGGALLAGTTE